MTIHQSALVKLMGNTGLFNITSEHVKSVRIHPQDKMCMLVAAGKIISLKDDEPITDGIIQANQTVLVLPEVPLVPSRYHALVSYNPALALSGAMVTPVAPIVRPGEEDMVGLVIRAAKKVDFSELSYVFELYQID